MICIRPMTAGDVALGMRLKAQAGWNQTEADWRRFLDMEPDGRFVAELHTVPVGTVTTCVFGSVAWIAMVLVDAAVRGQGLGKAMMVHALDFLDRRGVRSVRLDATPLGQPLYHKLGFVSQYQLARFEGDLPPAQGNVPSVEPVLREQWPALIQFDRAVTGTDRSKLLLHLFEEQPQALRVVQRTGEVFGFLTIKSGARAVQIGPCLATAEAGAMLLADAGHRYTGQHVFIDVPTDNVPAVGQCQKMGLKMQRHLLRMCRGEPVVEKIDSLWASSGPEKG